MMFHLFLLGSARLIWRIRSLVSIFIIILEEVEAPKDRGKRPNDGKYLEDRRILRGDSVHLFSTNISDMIESFWCWREFPTMG